MSSAISSSESSLRMRGPAARAQEDRDVRMSAGTIERRMPRVQKRASTLGSERHDVEVDPLEARGRALEVAVVDGEHDGAPRARLEDAREAVLHAPVVGARALQEERPIAGGHVEVEVLAVAAVGFGHRRAPMRSVGAVASAPAGHHIGCARPILGQSEDAWIDRGPARVAHRRTRLSSSGRVRRCARRARCRASLGRGRRRDRRRDPRTGPHRARSIPSPPGRGR